MGAKKESFKGDIYIPWSVMVSALYQLDPNASIEKVMNVNGGYVFTDRCEIKSIVAGVETTATALSHMVKICVTFMGKPFTEVYPVQDNDYTSSKVFDQNKVNKAQQRGLTRLISLATGLAWKIYENIESQFEDDGAKKPTKPELTKSKDESKSEAPKEAGKTVVSTNVTEDLVKLILGNKDNQALLTMLGNYNEVLKSKYVDPSGNPLELKVEDTQEELVSKLTVIENPDKMYKGLKKVIGA